MSDTTPRSWLLWAFQNDVNGVYTYVFENIKALEMADPSRPAHRIRATVDPEGSYMGWIYTDKPDKVVMVEHANLFQISFAYGYQAEEEAGVGKAYRLHIEPVEDES